MTKMAEDRIARRPYRKPQLEQVQLAVEEAVLSGCKASLIGAGPLTGGGNCEPGSNQCFFIQS
jgi:hypothetical protein